MIPSFHGMIPSFHAVFGLRQRDKSAKVIDYNDQVIRVREYLLFRGIPSPMYFQLSRKRQCTASFPANVIIPGCKRYHLCGPKNHSFADMGPRVKKYGIRASALSGYQSDAGTVSRAEDIAQPHWSALLGRR